MLRYEHHCPTEPSVSVHQWKQCNLVAMGELHHDSYLEIMSGLNRSKIHVHTYSGLRLDSQSIGTKLIDINMNTDTGGISKQHTISFCDVEILILTKDVNESVELLSLHTASWRQCEGRCFCGSDSSSCRRSILLLGCDEQRQSQSQ